MQSPHHLTICKFFYIVLTAIMYNPRMKVSTSGSPLSHNNSWASDDHQSVLKAAVLECLLNAISAEILEDEPCWIFRSAAQLRWDRATFLRSFGKQVSVMRILNSALLLGPSINFVFEPPQSAGLEVLPASPGLLSWCAPSCKPKIPFFFLFSNREA